MLADYDDAPDDVRALLDAAEAVCEPKKRPLMCVRVGFPNDPDTEDVTLYVSVTSADLADGDTEESVQLTCDEVRHGDPNPFPFDNAAGINTFTLIARRSTGGEWEAVGEYGTQFNTRGEIVETAPLALRAAEYEPETPVSRGPPDMTGADGANAE